MLGLPSKEHIDERATFKKQLRSYCIERLWPVQRGDGMHWQDIDVMNALLDCAEQVFGFGRSDHDEWCRTIDMPSECSCTRGKVKQKLVGAIKEHLKSQESFSMALKKAGSIGVPIEQARENLAKASRMGFDFPGEEK